jgi:hypothetical protein
MNMDYKPEKCYKNYDEVFGATKSKSHSKGNAVVFDETKLDRLGNAYNLDIKVEVRTAKEREENNEDRMHSAPAGC